MVTRFYDLAKGVLTDILPGETVGQYCHRREFKKGAKCVDLIPIEQIHEIAEDMSLCKFKWEDWFDAKPGSSFAAGFAFSIAKASLVVWE